MKRFLFVAIVLAAVVAVLSDRVPGLRDRFPWLPRVPYLTAQSTTHTADEAGAEGEAGGRRGRGRRGGRGGGGGPIPVLVAQSRYADIPVTVDILGTVQATNTVTVKSQVDGKLISVDFKEGQDVKKGDVLARVDPASFQATYDQAVAKKAQDESILANAQADLTRYTKLASTQYGSAQQADTQKALVTQTQAIVNQDQAAIDNAKTTLDYATIRSPIDGRTGLRLVDAGNIVHAADTTGLVTVTQVKPITVVFSLPQQYLRQVNAALGKAPLKAQALEGDNSTVLDEGTLTVVDNTVDQTTGTVKLKGTFPNDHLQLWPGQFVNIRLFIDTLSHVVVVPTTAVQRGPGGTFVYVLGTGDTVAMHQVTVGRQSQDDSVITGGLEVPATVVTTGFTRLTDGAKVAVGTATADANPRDGQPAEAGNHPGAAGANATPAERGTLPGGQRGGATVSQGDVETPAGENAVAQPGTGEPANAGGGRRHGHHRRDAGETQTGGGAAPNQGGQP